MCPRRTTIYLNLNYYLKKNSNYFDFTAFVLDQNNTMYAHISPHKLIAHKLLSLFCFNKIIDPR